MVWFGRIFKNVGLHIRTTLLAGVLITIPVVVTFVILKFVFDFFDPLLQPLFETFTDRYIRGMGVVALVIIIYLAGLVTTQVLGRRMIQLVQGAVDLIPVVRSVYRAARQATEVFSTLGASGNYSGVVLVDFPGNGLKSIGLVTGKLEDQDGNPLLAVYIPTSPFPTSGFLLILPPHQVTPTDMAVNDAMKLIVSAGTVGPGRIVSTPNPFRDGTPSPGFTSPPEGQRRESQGYDSRASNQ